MQNKREHLNLISYIYFSENKGSELIVILPRAGTNYSNYSILINTLKVNYPVLFIEEGYFGTTKAPNEAQLTKLNLKTFSAELYELIKKLGFTEVYILGESVGALHALYFTSIYNAKVKYLILASPAIYKEKLLVSSFHLLLANAFLVLPTDKVFRMCINLLDSIKNEKIKNLSNRMYIVESKLGAKSYALCLKEIALFPRKNKMLIKQILMEKSTVFLGENDSVFNFLCDKELCLNSPGLIKTAYGHDILDRVPSEVVNILKSH